MGSTARVGPGQEGAERPWLSTAHRGGSIWAPPYGLRRDLYKLLQPFEVCARRKWKKPYMPGGCERYGLFSSAEVTPSYPWGKKENCVGQSVTTTRSSRLPQKSNTWGHILYGAENSEQEAKIAGSLPKQQQIRAKTIQTLTTYQGITGNSTTQSAPSSSLIWLPP